MLTRNSGSGQSWPWTCDLLLIFLYSSRFEQVVALDHFEARSKTAADKLLINRIGPPVNHGNWICIHMYTWHRLTKQVHRYWSNWHSDHGKSRTCIGSRLGSRFMKGSPQLADLVTCAIAIVYKVLTKDLEYLSISGWPSLSFFFWWTFCKKKKQYLPGETYVSFTFIYQMFHPYKVAPQVISWFIIPLTIYRYIYHKS